MTEATLIERARQGHADAIAQFLSRSLLAQDVSVKAGVAQRTLWLKLESDWVNDPAIMRSLGRALLKLQLGGIQSVQVEAYETGESTTTWTETLDNRRSGIAIWLARYGDEAAIAHRIQQALGNEPNNGPIHVQAHLQDEYLHLLLESTPAPDAAKVLPLLQQEISSWQAKAFQTVEVYARQTDAKQPVWTQELDTQRNFSSPPTPTSTPNIAPTPASIPSARSVASRPMHSRATGVRSTTRSRTSSVVVPGAWTFKFEPLKLGLVVVLALYGLSSISDYTVSGFLNGSNGMMMFIHGVNLIFHEAGHTLFMPFGRFLHILGGSLMQILVPAFISGYFFYTRQNFAGAVALCWVGENFWDVSIYITDAQYRLLPLLGGDGVMHDWHFLLLDLRLLTKGHIIGGLAKSIGTIIYAIAIFAGVFYAQIRATEPDAEQSLK